MPPSLLNAPHEPLRTDRHQPRARRSSGSSVNKNGANPRDLGAPGSVGIVYDCAPFDGSTTHPISRKSVLTLE